MCFSIVFAVETSAGLRIANVGMAVAVTTLTVREIPEARSTLVTFTAVGVRATFTMACGCVAEVVKSPNTVTITSFATFGPETVGTRGTLVATATHDVDLAFAVTPIFVTDFTHGTRNVALTSYNNN